MTLAASGCADPGSRYNDYLDETESQRGFRGGGGKYEGVSVGADLTGSYHLSCLSNFLGREPKLALRFKLDVSVTMNEDGTANSTFTYTPLKYEADNLSATTGDPVTTTQSLTINSRFESSLGDVIVPSDGNPTQSGNNIGTADIVMTGGFLTRTSGCGELAGALTEPVPSPLTDPGDTCVFVKSTDGSAPEILDLAVYNDCPSF
ncbi:MAG: hypothetical protein U0165_20770 [Polyangiaceae bacterium]